MSEFTPFRHVGGDLWQRVGGHWRELSRSVAWGHIVDLLSEAEHASSLGDTVHAKRLASDANCLLTAVGEHDEWHRCTDRPAPVREKEGQRA